MNPAPAEIVCCGHLCLDIMPTLRHDALPGPGELAAIGPAVITAGGSVANTGLALQKIGTPVRLVGRIGDDPFGQEVQRQFDAVEPGLSESLLLATGEPTSYSIVLSPPGGDRRFLHCPGPNQTFTANHVPDRALVGARHLHFGYPPVMHAMCTDSGQPLAELFQRARRQGLTTSLDLCGIDPSTWAGTYDWSAFLSTVLPHVDLFLPSRDELQVMSPAGAEHPDQLLELGCRVVMIKDGADAVTVGTADTADHLVPGWGAQSLKVPTYGVEVIDTTGAGDVTIAGFLAAFVRKMPLKSAIQIACSAGAHCVQARGAIPGVPLFDALKAFVERHENPARI